MPHASLLRAQRQQVADDRLVGGVVAVTAADRTGEVEHCLDASSHAARRHRLVIDHWFKGLEHQPAVDRRNGKIAEHWIGIACERGPPLLAVLGVAPLARVHGEIVLGALTERHLLGVLARAASTALLRASIGSRPRASFTWQSSLSSRANASETERALPRPMSRWRP